MKNHLIRVKYKTDKSANIWMARAFTRKEILDIAKEVYKFTDNVYYNEIATTFICENCNDVDKILEYLYENYGFN